MKIKTNERVCFLWAHIRLCVCVSFSVGALFARSAFPTRPCMSGQAAVLQGRWQQQFHCCRGDILLGNPLGAGTTYLDIKSRLKTHTHTHTHQTHPIGAHIQDASSCTHTQERMQTQGSGSSHTHTHTQGSDNADALQRMRSPRKNINVHIYLC